MTFKPDYMQMFTGGRFEVGQPKTVRELRDTLRAMDEELAKWGDDQAIAEVFVHHGKINVTLSEGIPG